MPLASAVLKAVTLFLSFVLVFYFLRPVSFTSRRTVVAALVKFIVSGIAVVAFFAIIEQRTVFNVFDHLRSRASRFMQFEGSITVGSIRTICAAGSADHPIALGVLFAMGIPLGVALA